MAGAEVSRTALETSQQAKILVQTGLHQEAIDLILRSERFSIAQSTMVVFTKVIANSISTQELEVFGNTAIKSLLARSYEKPSARAASANIHMVIGSTKIERGEDPKEEFQKAVDVLKEDQLFDRVHHLITAARISRENSLEFKSYLDKAVASVDQYPVSDDESHNGIVSEKELDLIEKSLGLEEIIETQIEFGLLDDAAGALQNLEEIYAEAKMDKEFGLEHLVKLFGEKLDVELAADRRNNQEIA